MIGWTEDHNTAGDVIKSGRRLQTKPPIPENGSGPLILYMMDGKVKYIQEKSDSEPTSLRIEKRQPLYPIKPDQSAPLVCSLLKYGIENGIATMWVSVRDPQDTVMQGLRPDSFEVLETANGRSTPIRNVSVLSKSDRLAVAVVLVRDVSPSQGKDALAISENALKSFLDDMLPDDMAGLVTFAGHSSVKKLTDNKDSVKKSMHVPLFRISTSFFDALDTAIGMLSDSRKGYLNTIIAFTDGQDTGSKKSASDVLQSAKQASIPIFIIGVGSVNEPELRMIAQQTNGLYFPVAEQMTLDKIYSRLSEMLNNTIVISYPTTAKRGNDVQASVNVNYTNGSKSYEGQFQSGTWFISPHKRFAV